MVKKRKYSRKKPVKRKYSRKRLIKRKYLRKKPVKRPKSDPEWGFFDNIWTGDGWILPK